MDLTPFSTGEVKYYDFEFPEANKMTLIVERAEMEYGDDLVTNDFSLTIPGVLYEASYSIYVRSHYCWSFSYWTSCSGYLNLYVDGTQIFSGSSGGSPGYSWQNYYGYYDPSNHLQTGVSHYVYLEGRGGGGVATVLIYEN